MPQARLRPESGPISRAGGAGVRICYRYDIREIPFDSPGFGAWIPLGQGGNMNTGDDRLIDEPTLLKALLKVRHWQKLDTFAHQWDKVAKIIDPRLVGSCPAHAQFYRWLRGSVRSMPHPDACMILEGMFPEWTVQQLFRPVRTRRSALQPTPVAKSDSDKSAPKPVQRLKDPSTGGDDARLGLITAGTERVGPPATRLGQVDGPSLAIMPSGSIDQGETFLAAAHESTQDAVLRAARTSDALDIMRNQMIETARRYSYRAPIAIFTEARHTRNLAYQITDRTRRPSELADLYVVAGTANALMASIAFDLGHWDAARSLAQSATAYADLAGHASLEAWTWGLQATLANWRRDLSHALDYFERGLAIAPRGASRLRLRYIAARTYAGLGDTGATADVLAAARMDHDAMKSAGDELQNEIRGEFEFNDARAAACAAAAWLELREGDRAEEYAHVALDKYFELPEETRPFSPVNGIRINIASARLLSRDLDGASDSLRPVLALNPAMRNTALIGRLKSTREILGTPIWAQVSGARDLTEGIDQWTSNTAAAPLPAEEIS